MKLITNKKNKKFKIFNNINKACKLTNKQALLYGPASFSLKITSKAKISITKVEAQHCG